MTVLGIKLTPALLFWLGVLLLSIGTFVHEVRRQLKEKK